MSTVESRTPELIAGLTKIYVKRLMILKNYSARNDLLQVLVFLAKFFIPGNLFSQCTLRYAKLCEILEFWVIIVGFLLCKILIHSFK